MVPTPYFTDTTQHSSDETLSAYWFSVSASITHSLHHQNFVPICVALRPVS